jgi:type I restriction enzyme S subunit
MSVPRYPEYKDSGVEWLGEVPSHWEVRKFRHMFTESPEKIGDEVVGPMLSVSGYRGIEVKEYDDDNRRRQEEELVGYRVVRPGQLVVNTMWLNYAGLGVSGYEGHVSPAYRSYWIDASFNKRFVHHMMRSESFVRGYTKFLTGIRPNSLQMSRDDLMAFQLLRPSAEEQSVIAAFLDRETAKIDALVAEQEKLIALLKEKRQAVISHAVTKGLDPDVPMKDSGIEWLGEVPAHWTIGPLKRFADVIDCKHHTVSFLDEGRPIVSIRELRDDRIDLSNAKLTSRNEWDYLREGRVPQQGDLIFCRNASVGAVGYVDQEAQFCMGQDVCLIRPQGLGRFMHYQLISPVVRDQIEALLVGATIRRANVEEIRGLIVVWPTEKEQAIVSTFLDRETAKLDALTAEAQRGIELLKERRSVLISAAVTGKIDVRGLAGTH